MLEFCRSDPLIGINAFLTRNKTVKDEDHVSSRSWQSDVRDPFFYFRLCAGHSAAQLPFLICTIRMKMPVRGQEKIHLLCFFQVPLHWYFSTLHLLIGTTFSDITSMNTQVLMEIKIKESGKFTNHYSFGVVVTFPKIYIFKRHKRPLPNLLATFTCVTLRTPKI